MKKESKRVIAKKVVDCPSCIPSIDGGGWTFCEKHLKLIHDKAREEK